MIIMVKKIRVDIDKIICILLDIEEPSYEVLHSIICAKTSKMWLGKMLYFLGEKSPYIHSKNASNTLICESSDIWKGNAKNELLGVGYIQKLKHLRLELEGMHEYMYEKIHVESNHEAELCFDKSFTDLILAGMWLGNELKRIREAKKTK